MEMKEEELNALYLTDEQLWLVQRALDFYSRIGIGQFNEIKDHPSFERRLHEAFRLKEGPVEVGDKTPRGEVVEIGPKRKWIKTKGTWGNGEEVKKWTDVENVTHSTDYSRFHATRDAVDSALTYPRNLLIQDMSMPQHGSWGIYNPSVDDTCRMAFDIVQVIRHEKWKINPNRSEVTVDSHIHFSHRSDDSSQKIRVELRKKKEDEEQV